MIKCMNKAWATLVEVDRIVDHQEMVFMDRLSDPPRKIKVFDRATAARAARYDNLLCWIVPYPHYHRIGPAGIHVPRDLTDLFLDGLRLMAKEMTGREDPEAVRMCLSDQYIECTRLVSRLAEERTQQMLRNLDLRECVAEYKLKAGREKVEDILRQLPDFRVAEPNIEGDDSKDALYFDWLRLGQSKALEKKMTPAFRHKGPEDGVGSVGRVELFPDRMNIRCLSRLKHNFAKRMAEKYLGDLIAFRGERVIDLAKQAAEPRVTGQPPLSTENDESKEPSAVPPEVARPIIEKMMRGNYQRILDERIPMLNNKTPRMAARDRAMRSLLLDWVKLHINGMERRKKDGAPYVDLSHVVEELGLHELR